VRQRTARTAVVEFPASLVVDVRSAGDAARRRRARTARRAIMSSGKFDEMKGKVKEATGTLTGNEKLKSEGKADQAVGKTKQNVQKVADKVKDALD
jgi:uncharacterized protein YjbJ (UPF0337 family)